MTKHEELIEQIAVRNKLGKTFVDFMTQRFPEEGDSGYIQEWADRFKSGEPEIYMDKISRDVYEKIILTKILTNEFK